MLVTDVGGLAEIVPHKSRLRYIPKPKDIADSIVDFYTNDREVDFAKHLLKN